MPQLLERYYGPVEVVSNLLSMPSLVSNGRKLRPMLEWLPNGNQACQILMPKRNRRLHRNRRGDLLRQHPQLKAS